MKQKVYFTKNLDSKSVLKLYEKLGFKLEGNVAIKLHSGEQGNQNFLKPDFFKEIIEKVNALGEPVTYLGDGVEAFAEILEEKTTVPYSFAPLHVSKQRAGALAARALELFQNGVVQTAAEHEPDYLRLSQAERELKEKQAGEK